MRVSLCTCVYASLKAVSRPGFADRPKCCSLCRKGHSGVPVCLSRHSISLIPACLLCISLPTSFHLCLCLVLGVKGQKVRPSLVCHPSRSVHLDFAQVCAVPLLPIGHPSQSQWLLPEFYWCASSLCARLFLNATHHMIDR